jgi:hypothetical protein
MQTCVRAVPGVDTLLLKALLLARVRTAPIHAFESRNLPFPAREQQSFPEEIA